MSEALRKLIEHHSEQCSRLVWGQCATNGCLRRGGYTGGAVSFDVATCQAYETVQALEAFRALAEEE